MHLTLLLTLDLLVFISDFLLDSDSARMWNWQNCFTAFYMRETKHLQQEIISNEGGKTKSKQEQAVLSYTARKGFLFPPDV